MSYSYLMNQFKELKEVKRSKDLVESNMFNTNVILKKLRLRSKENRVKRIISKVMGQSESDHQKKPGYLWYLDEFIHFYHPQ